MVGYIKGHKLNLYLLINGKYESVARATDCTLTITGDIVETTTRNSKKGKTYDFSGKYSYKLDAKGISNLVDIANFTLFQLALMQSNKMLFLFTDLNSVEWSGTVLITETGNDSPVGGISSFSNTMQGDGELSVVTTNVPPLPPATGIVQIIDQFGAIVATVPAPGMYSVLRFNLIDCGHAVKPPNQLLIIAGE